MLFRTSLTSEETSEKLIGDLIPAYAHVARPTALIEFSLCDSLIALALHDW
jgi:hypothetical protein